MNVGDFVLYSTKGICKVDSAQKLKFSNEAKNYYILIPVFDQNSKYYLPVDFDPMKVKIRSAIEPTTVDELMKYSKECEPFDWLQNANLRREKNDEIIKSADHKRMLRLIKTLRTHEEEQKAQGKKMYLSDIKALKSAIKLISNEFAFVKGSDPKELEEYFQIAV